MGVGTEQHMKNLIQKRDRFCRAFFCFGPADRRDFGLAGLYGVSLSAALLIGGMLERRGAVALPSKEDIALFVLRAAVMMTAVRCLWMWKDRRRSHGIVFSKRQNRCCGFLLWSFFMAVQMISLLAVYPGFFVYDASEELAMVQTRVFTTHHPLLHVLLLGGSILAVHKVSGSYQLGIFCYLVYQMAVMDAVLVLLTREVEYAAQKSRTKEVPPQKRQEPYDPKDTAGYRGSTLLTILWLAFCPVITMFVLCSCKDGLFAAAAVAMTVFLRRILGGAVGPAEEMPGKKEEERQCKRRDALGFVLSASLMMLLRNNGVYAYAVFVVLAGICAVYRKRKSRQAKKRASGAFGSFRAVKGAMLGLTPLLLYALITEGLILGTHAAHTESQEILTVPIMQLARVWNADQDSFTKEEQDLMLQLMGAQKEEASGEGDETDAAAESSGWDLYNPVLSDQVKLHFQSDFYREHRVQFWRLWLTKGLQHPVSYLNAWLMTSYGFWTPGAIVDCYDGNTAYTFTYGESSYFGYETELPGVRESRLAALDAWYRFLSLDLRAQQIPVLGWVLSPGVMAWAWALCLLTMQRDRRGPELLAYVPIVLIWLTVLLGPCTLPRYVVYLWFGMPLPAADMIYGEPAAGEAAPGPDPTEQEPVLNRMM